jgi:hypothetical protein
MTLKKAGRPKSAEVRKAFQVLLLAREKRQLKRASEREGFRSLSAWMAHAALHRAKGLTSDRG